MRLFPKRRWLRFSIRTLLATVTVFCVWLSYYKNWQMQRAAALDKFPIRNVPSSGPGPDSDRGIPLGLQLLGEEPAWLFFIPDELPQESRDELRSLFPEAELSEYPTS